MTRKEQIEQAAVEYQMRNKPMAIGGDAFADMTYRLNINPAFVAGAEWADKQFEKERLDKMYAWLKENIKDYAFVHSYSSNVNIDIDTLIEDLQKAMEE